MGAHAPGGGSLPAGGTTGQVLTKESNADGDADWETIGGSLTTTHEELSGNAVMIADADGAWLTWDVSAGPDTLIDRSTPAHPTVIEAGVYIVSVVVHAGALHQGGYFDAGLYLDRTGFNASMTATSSQADTSTGSGIVNDLTLAFAWYIPAGGQIGVFVDHLNDGGFSAGFSIPYAHIQRLSEGGGSSSSPTTVSFPLTSAQILACFTTPITLVASPGPGKALVVSTPFIQVIGQTVGYTVVATLGVYADLASATLWADATTPLAFAGDQFANCSSLVGPFDAANVEDKPLIFTAATADPTNGDGDAIVSFMYHVVDIA